jgi:hypothetical protein
MLANPAAISIAKSETGQDGLHSRVEEAPPYRAVVDANRQLTGPV